MPSFNHEKLDRLLERARSARLSTQDISARLRDVRSDCSSLESGILRIVSGGGRGIAPQVTELLRLPLSEAELIEDDVLLSWNINPQNFHALQDARKRMVTLASNHEKASLAYDAASGGLNTLCEAVISWGFPDPRLEL